MSNITKEFEARVMIDENQYQEIINYYLKNNPHSSFIQNTNYYFDNEKYYLTSHHVTLRLRMIDEKEYELTCKIKGKNGDQEINDSLNENEKQFLLSRNIFPQGQVKNYLFKLDENINSYRLLTSLTTKRLEVKEKDHLFVIDMNNYGGNTDYNLEVESFNLKNAKKYLEKYCAFFNVKLSKEKYIGKAHRALQASAKQS